MENISIQPSQRMFTKSVMIIATISVFIFLTGIILQIAIPMNGRISAEEAAAIIWSAVTIIILLKWIFALTIAVLWIKNLAYVIQEDRIIIYKGILTKIEQNIPYKAITDFMLHRSIFDRILHIGSIKIQTAGQSINATGYEGIISCLTDYTGIMNILRARLQKYHGIDTMTDNTTGMKNESYSAEILKELKIIRSLLEKKSSPD